MKRPGNVRGAIRQLALPQHCCPVLFWLSGLLLIFGPEHPEHLVVQLTTRLISCECSATNCELRYLNAFTVALLVLVLLLDLCWLRAVGPNITLAGQEVIAQRPAQKMALHCTASDVAVPGESHDDAASHRNRDRAQKVLLSKSTPL